MLWALVFFHANLTKMPRFRCEKKREKARLDEARVLVALEDFDQGNFKSLAACARQYRLNPRQLQRRRQNGGSRRDNGGHNKRLTEAENLALLAWANFLRERGHRSRSCSSRRFDPPPPANPFLDGNKEAMGPTVAFGP